MPNKKQNKQFQTLLFAAFAVAGILILYFASAAPAKVTFDGTYEVAHSDDFENKKAVFEGYIITDKGKKYKLDFGSEQIPQYLSGSKIKVNGLLGPKAKGLLPSVGNIKLNSSNFTVSQAAEPQASRVHKVAVLMSMKRGTTEPTVSKDEVLRESVVVNDYFQEMSFGLRSLTGVKEPNHHVDYYGPYAANWDANNCNEYAGSPTLSELAAADGYRRSDYDNVIEVTPCGGGAGRATVSGGGGWVWMYGGFPASIVAHELGHNFGVWHANSWVCQDGSGNTVSLSQNCTHYEYGDLFDRMGGGIFLHFNATFKKYLRFIPETNQQIVQTSGEYTIAPQEAATSRIQQIVVPRTWSYSSEGHQLMGEVFTIEYRRPFGYDYSQFRTGHFEGVFIRHCGNVGTINSSSCNMTRRLNMTPESHPLTSALPIGRCFYDDYPYRQNPETRQNRKVVIETVSRTATEARVRITFDTIKDCDAFNVPRNPYANSGQTSDPVIITWGPPQISTNVAGYNVYRANYDGTGLIKIGSTAETRFSDTTADKSKAYWYSVSSYNTASPPKESFRSADAIFDKVLPSVPQRLTLSNKTQNSVTLSWDRSTDVGVGVKEYHIWRGTCPTCLSFVDEVKHRPYESPTYIASIEPNTNYYFAISARDGLRNDSANSNLATLDQTPPSVPANLTALRQGATSVKLSWSPSTDTDGVAKYDLYRGTTASNLTALATINHPTTTYTDETLSTSVPEYYYAVRAIDNQNNPSAFSSPPVKYKTNDATPPSIPSGLKADSRQDTNMTISWNASIDADGSVAGYKIFKNGSSTPVGTSQTNSFTDTGLTQRTAYSYTVLAFDSSQNESAKSSSASFTTTSTTITTISQTINPTVTGQTTTFPISVSTKNPTSTTDIPSGSVRVTTTGPNNFKEDKDWPLTPTGQTTHTFTYPAAGVYQVVAKYLGDQNHAQSQASLSHTVNQATTTSAVASASSAYADPITFQITVQGNVPGGAAGSTFPKGEVSVYDRGSATSGDGVYLCTAALGNNGTGNCTYTSPPPLSEGNHHIRAVYKGSNDFKGSETASAHLVQTRNTVTSLVSTPNPSKDKEKVTLTAAVTSGHLPTPAGTVTFTEGTTTLGTSTLDANGKTTLEISNFSVGNHTLKATYNTPNCDDSASCAYLGSASPEYVHVVTKCRIDLFGICLDLF